MMTDQAQIPPHNYEAEQGLLGAIISSNAAYDRVAGFLRPEHFAHPAHGRIYAACKRLIESGTTANYLTLRGPFDQDPDLKEHGGAQYLARLAASVPTVAAVKDYGVMIYDLWKRRAMIDTFTQGIAAAHDMNGELTPDEMAQTTARVMDEILESAAGAGLRHYGEALDRSIELSERAANTPGQISGLSLGLIDLDRKLGGLEPEQLVIIAARPGMGKTAFATSIAVNVAKRDKPVAIFSHEMSSLQLANRMISYVSGVPLLDLKFGTTTPEQKQAARSARDYLKGLPLFIDDAAGQSPSMIRAKARSFKRRHGLSLVIVDHLQIMIPDTRSNNRTSDMTEITGALKRNAKELAVPIIALSQLSRAVEQRDPPRPVLADLRESGSIEQDADIVAFLYREEYYRRRNEPPKDSPMHIGWEADVAVVRGEAEIILAKGRDLEPGRVAARFNGECVAYENLAKEQERTAA